MKKIISIVILIGFMALLSGCEGVREEPVYEDLGDEMMIGAWVAPPPTKDSEGNYLYITEEHYQNIKDSGIKVIYGLYDNTIPDILAALDMAELVGIDYYVYHWGLRGLFQDVFDSQGNPIPEEVESDFDTFKSIVDNFKDHKAFKGIKIWDEPSAGLYKGFALYKTKFDEYLPGKDFYINLFPTYASIAQRGGVDYEEYISQYVDLIGMEFISYDHYPLMLFYEESVLTDDYLLNLEIIANQAVKSNVPFWLFIQTISYSNITGTQTRRPTEADIRWQVAVSMAYGAKGIQHFTYWTPIEGGVESFTPGMIEVDGTKGELYEAASKVNHEVLSFDHVYLQFDWKGVLTHSADPDDVNVNFRMISPLESHKRIRSIESENDVLIGTFKDKDDNDGFMIVNFEDPFYGKTNEVEIRFKDATHAIVFIKGEKETVELDKGILRYDLESGEGIFVIPY